MISLYLIKNKVWDLLKELLHIQKLHKEVNTISHILQTLLELPHPSSWVFFLKLHFWSILVHSSWRSSEKICHNSLFSWIITMWIHFLPGTFVPFSFVHTSYFETKSIPAPIAQEFSSYFWCCTELLCKWWQSSMKYHILYAFPKIALRLNQYSHYVHTV